MSILYFLALCCDIYWMIIRIVIALAVRWGYIRLIIIY